MKVWHEDAHTLTESKMGEMPFMLRLWLVSVRLYHGMETGISSVVRASGLGEKREMAWMPLTLISNSRGPRIACQRIDKSDTYATAQAFAYLDTMNNSKKFPRFRGIGQI